MKKKIQNYLDKFPIHLDIPCNISIYLGNYSIGDIGAKELPKIIENNKNLKILTLNCIFFIYFR